MNRLMARNPGIGRMLVFSMLLHVAVYWIVSRFGHFNSFNPAPQTYYVDIVNLPVANPRSGTPSKPEKTLEDQTAASRQEMALPVQHREKTEKSIEPTPVKKTNKEEKPDTTEEEFRKRMAKIENQVEGGHESSALEAIRKKLMSNGRAGIPGGSGSEAGSDYAGYIQSRLRDAFKTTISYQSGSPEVVIRLRISRYGKIIGYTMEKSSHDKVFETSVRKAIEIAGENFPPPPDKQTFDHGYIFKPEGVGTK